MIGLSFTESTGYLKYTGLVDFRTGAYINDATLTVTLVDSDGNEVSGETWPLGFSYIAGSNGNYHALLDSGLFTVEENLTAKVDITGNTLERHIEMPIVVKVDQNVPVSYESLIEELEIAEVL